MLEEVVGMANNNQTNLITAVTISPLEELQRRFAIIDLGGEIRVVDQNQVAARWFVKW
jgi:phage terminase large subunit-like protein